MSYVYPLIVTLYNDETLQTGEKQHICGACAIPTCLSVLKNDEKDPLDVYSTLPLENNLTIFIRNKHAVNPRNECRCCPPDAALHQHACWSVKRTGNNLVSSELVYRFHTNN